MVIDIFPLFENGGSKAQYLHNYLTVLLNNFVQFPVRGLNKLKLEVKEMFGYGNIDGGGGNCGCCCSYQAESFTSAQNNGRGDMYGAGSCCGSCQDYNTANLNANVATAIDRMVPDGK